MELDTTLCCGCGACANICPTGAISWGRDGEGFSAPALDQSKCIDCGLCRRVCPYEHSHVGVEAKPDIYAALHRDAEVVKRSSSGGVFTALSDWVLGQKGVVYGVAFDESYRLCYRRAETAEARDAFRGSKYVQCDGKDVFPQVSADLNAGRTVLFTGTPCQVSGLRDYLAVKRAPTENLYLVDNLCHGAASPAVWETYLDYIREKVLTGKTIRAFSMRSKDTPWQRQDVSCTTEAGDESRVLNEGASWNKLYLTTYATRNSCFHCRFTSFDRVGDISLADYWNIENAGLSLDYSGGINLVLVNTDKGRAWFKACQDHLRWQKSDKKSCWQIHLERPAVPNSKRAAFWQAYRADPMATVARFGRGSRFNAMTRVLSPVLRKLGVYTLAVRLLSTVKGHGTGS